MTHPPLPPGESSPFAPPRPVSLFAGSRTFSSPRNRIFLYVGLLLAVAGSMQNCRARTAAGLPPVPPAEAQQYEAAAEGATAADPLPGLSAYSSLNLVRENILGGVRNDDADPWSATDMRGYSAALEDACRWLKGQSDESLAAAARPRSHWTFNKVMREPDRWRLQVLHVYGRLVHERTEEFAAEGPGLRKLWRLTLYDNRFSHFITVLTPLRPAAAKVGESHIACDGLFLMRYPYVKESGSWQRTALFLARRAVLAREPSTQTPLLDERADPGPPYRDLAPTRTASALSAEFIEQEVLEPAPDGSDGMRMLGGDLFAEAADLRQEKAALDHAFEFVYGLTPESLESRVDPAMTYVALMETPKPPAWARGRFARIEARAADVQTLRFSDADNGVERIHLLAGWDARLAGFRHSWVMAALNLPPGLRQDDRIEAVGLFVKRMPYRTTQGRWQFAPLVVCREIRILPPVSTGGGLVAFGGVAMVLGLLFVFWLSRRDTSELDDLRSRERKRKRIRWLGPFRKRAAPPAEPAPEAPPAPPPPPPEEKPAP